MDDKTQRIKTDNAEPRRGRGARLGITKWILLAALVAATPAPASELGPWLKASHDVGCQYDDADWHCKPTTLPNFIPLGFSPDGWFAWVTEPQGNVVTFEGPYCKDPPCAGIGLINLNCDGECLSDSPSRKGDQCYCPIGATDKELKKFRIDKIERLDAGCFPLQRGGDDFSVDIVYKEKLIYPEAIVLGETPQPEFPGTEIYLVSKNRGRKRIHTVDHNHGEFAAHTVQAVGWLNTPYPDRIVVIIAGGTAMNMDGFPTAVSNLPIPVDLSTGWSR